MAGEGGGREMNGAAGCRGRLSVLDPPASEGWGPVEPGPPSCTRFTLLGPGPGPGPGRRRGAGIALSLPRSSFLLRPLPALPPLRWAAPPEEVGTVASRGAAVAVEVVAVPDPPGFLFSPRPILPAGSGTEGMSAGTGLAQKREKRSAPCRFCKIAVTTLPRVWVGKGKDRSLKMGT